MLGKDRGFGPTQPWVRILPSLTGVSLGKLRDGTTSDLSFLLCKREQIMPIILQISRTQIPSECSNPTGQLPRRLGLPRLCILVTN